MRVRSHPQCRKKKNSFGNLLVNLQLKRLGALRAGPKASLRCNFNAAQATTDIINYIDYFETCWWSVRAIFWPGHFFGLAFSSYYSLDLTWKKKLFGTNNYWYKFDVKKDTRFFYGIVLRRHLNFLASSITIWNVFYNELMEKTIPIFSVWNTLLGELTQRWIWHLLGPYIKNISWKKNVGFLRQYPWALQWIVLKTPNIAQS